MWKNISELKNSGFKCVEITSMDYDLETLVRVNTWGEIK